MDRHLEDVLKGLDELAKQQQQHDSHSHLERGGSYSAELDSAEGSSHNSSFYDAGHHPHNNHNQAQAEEKVSVESQRRKRALHAWAAK